MITGSSPYTEGSAVYVALMVAAPDFRACTAPLSDTVMLPAPEVTSYVTAAFSTTCPAFTTLGVICALESLESA